MTTRRNKLIPRSALDSRGAPPKKPRFVTIRDLQEVRVNVPPELYETNMSLIVLVGLDGKLNPGLIPNSEMPNIKPYQDLLKLQRARGVVSSLEVSNSKQSVVNEVKNQVTSALIDNKIKPEEIHLKIGAQSELIKSKALAGNLLENFELFSNSPHSQSATYKTIATKWFENSIKSINDYCLNTLCKNQPETMADILFKNFVPKWFYNKFSIGKSTELTDHSIDDIFFPKKLSKMITFTEREVSNLDFVNNALNLSLQLNYLHCIVNLYPTKEKEAILYPLPNDFSKHFSKFSDLPQLDRTSDQSTILSITVIHMVYCAIPIKVLTNENLVLHEESFLFQGKEILNNVMNTIEFAEELVKTKPKIERFKYIPELSSTIKAQYKEHFTTEGYPKVTGFRLHERLCQIFNITKEEVKALGGVLIFDYKNFDYKKLGTESMFRQYQKEISESFDRDRYIEALSLIKPIVPKELSFGPPNSTFSANSLRFLKNLEKAKFNQVFQQNVKMYLQSFFAQNFQDQAVKIMEATLQARIITIQEIEEPPNIAEESDNPLADFS
jgi:hypothetical protein